jgi:ATP-dependent Clp protease ATP-binding subunit ClpB
LKTNLRHLDEAHRKITRLEIEKEALAREVEEHSEKTETKNRIKEIAKEIANVRETTNSVETRWNNEKEILADIRKIKKQIDLLRVESENAELSTDLAKVAEIRYGKIPALEKTLKAKNDRLKKIKMNDRLLREEVTEEDVANVVAKWTNIPVTRMLQEESKRLMHMEAELNDA